ncbi:Helix-turn-helix transcriptional regulator [Candidatus Hepatincolaceae symbiont of Richtersius coronifer]
MKKQNTTNGNNNFGQLLELEVKKKFKNQLEFAKQINVTQATVSRYISGQALPSFQVLKKISAILGIDLALINPSEFDKPQNTNIMRIPFFYSEVSAGQGLATLDSSHEYLNFDETWLKNQFIINNTNDVFAVKVKGDSMEPVIQEGDIVFAQKSYNDITTQGVYIVCYNDDYFIKKIQFKSKNVLKLISSNPDYDPIEVNLEDSRTIFRLIAKVIGRINLKSFTNYS